MREQMNRVYYFAYFMKLALPQYQSLTRTERKREITGQSHTHIYTKMQNPKQNISRLKQAIFEEGKTS